MTIKFTQISVVNSPDGFEWIFALDTYGRLWQHHTKTDRWTLIPSPKEDNEREVED